MDDDAIAALFAASRTLVQCSDSESFGMSVAEALTAGLPVVVTDRSPWSQVGTLGCGYSVAHEPSAVASAVLQILEHPAEGCAMGARGKAWAREDVRVGRDWTLDARCVSAGARPIATPGVTAS